MRVAVSHSIEDAYWTAVASALDSAATPGKLRLYSGPVPVRGVVANPGNVLVAEFNLQKPAAASISNGVLTLANIPPAPVASTETIGYAVAVNGDGVFVAHLDTGLAGSGAAWVWTNLSFSIGDSLAPTVLTLRFPA